MNELPWWLAEYEFDDSELSILSSIDNPLNK